MGFFDRLKKNAPSYQNIEDGEKTVADTQESYSIIGSQSTNGILSIKVLEESISKQSNCFHLCPNDLSCCYLNFGNNNKHTLFWTTEVVLLIENLSENFTELYYSDFSALDIDGITHKPIRFCDKYSYPYLCNSSIKLPPHSKIKYLVSFPTITTQLTGIIYNDNKPISIREGNITTISDLKDKIIEDLKAKIEELKEQVESLKSDNASRVSFKSADSIKFKVEEDDEWYTVYSAEEESTVSFNREFDKSKSNYNWINIGDPLITIRIDSVPQYMCRQTKIASPVSGLFEFSKNKLIGCGEIICRVKKIPAELKQETIDELERAEIKRNVYLKERKKMIERETLDELIAEGKVFNVITKKDGNRMAIPQDVASAVWNRDGGRCCMCGSKTNLEFDHIIPLSKGGATTFRNLQLLCRNCNIKKSDNI